MDNINTGIETVQQPPVPEVKPGFVSKVSEKIPPKIKDLFAKFYANKKIFWPVTISFGLLFLVVVLGLIFGSKTPAPESKPSPTIFIVSTPEASPSGDIISVTERQLKDLKLQITSLDLKQSRLTPPEVNYDVSF